MSMLKVVVFVVGWTFLHSQTILPCEDYNIDNCGQFNCVEVVSETVVNGETVEVKNCGTDPCYSLSGNEAGVGRSSCSSVPGGKACRLVTLDWYESGGGTRDKFCITADTHFSDCKLATPPSTLTLFNKDKWCRNTAFCGGLDWFYENDTLDGDGNPVLGVAHYFCAELGARGALYPGKFDVANCKHPNFFINSSNQCDVDTCLDYDPTSGTDCTDAGCSIKNVGGSDYCLANSHTFTPCALSWDEKPDEKCAAKGCGEIKLYKTVPFATTPDGDDVYDVYFYCDEVPPPVCEHGCKKAGTTSLHIPVLASLLTIAVSAFFF